MSTGDGDIDLVVLGTSPASGHGGVSVFINQGIPATAVMPTRRPRQRPFRWGPTTPTRFNPATTIPLAVPAGARNVDLTIYNVLGQPLRQVWTGPAAGWRASANVGWPRRAGAAPVAAGVYVYRLQVEEQTRTPQNGQNRIGEPTLEKTMRYALLISFLWGHHHASCRYPRRGPRRSARPLGQPRRGGSVLRGRQRFHLDVAGRTRRKPVAALGRARGHGSGGGGRPRWHPPRSP